ncbi:hypothetical protein M422DRAFT_48183 [Sphaerobolus stellatus SS14]|uniref:Uncharacterized protein n=1 Tax=Sphaerobolus stellatus (strain SS14) TaxID=990650 RepID=A0A0C9VVC7_SPHS4|nr:hypothetical protein M422DRAFT_48183 [Sphaerobolus stellatus SS14]
MGSYTSVVNDTDCDLYIIYGANQVGLTIAQLATAVLGFIAAIPSDSADMELVVALETMESALDFTGNVLVVTEKAIELSVKNHGLHGPYGKNSKYVSGKLSLNLVHQANVIAVKKNGDGRLTVYSGSFTVWSGSTNNSTKTYNLSSHLRDLDMRIVTPVDHKATPNLKEKIATYKTLVKQHGLKV